MRVSVQGCAIIVFPEYGLVPLGMKSRSEAVVFMEQVPDPHAGVWIPCRDPPADRDPVAVQRALSCLALDYSLYVVANVGAVDKCDTLTDSSCPEDGHFQFNTNVVYDPTGRLVARYRKYNLFVTELHIFDKPRTAEIVYFDTPFGRVGTLVCFDMIFHAPAVRLIERGNVSHVTFPTMWTNKLPYYSAGPFHQSYAAAQRVNVLAANIRYTSKGCCGSGVYGWDGVPRAFRCTDDGTSALIVAEITPNPDKAEVAAPLSTTEFSDDLEGAPDFSGPIFQDLFNLVLLRSNTGVLSVCHGDLCCWLNYTTAGNGTDRFALGAFKGLHTFEGQYYLEICLLMACLNGSEAHCGEGATTSATHFSFFNLTGNFTTKYVYPQVVTDGVQPTTDAWEFTRGVGQLVLPRPSTDPLLSATLYGRRFDLDDARSRSKDIRRTGHRHRQPVDEL